MSSPIVAGFRFSGVHCGIKKNGRPDLGLIVADQPVACAGVYTTNQVVAAPVVLSRYHLSQAGRAQAIIINSGNANACTGPQGDSDALEMVRQTAERIGCSAEHVQVCSTGVIGAPLPMEAISSGITAAFTKLDKGSLRDFADAICTTDTFRKLRTKVIDIGGRSIHIAGVSKGAGMIHPNMATMLGVVVTDAPVDDADLQAVWERVCAGTFNAITVDGDTSTNDTALILASGQAGGKPLVDDDLVRFEMAVFDVALELAKDIVRDAEGGTKVVEVRVCGTESVDQARQIAQTIALSPLVKTAFHGEDPNWGRIIAAAGRSGVDLDPNLISLSIGGHRMYDRGVWQGPIAEKKAHDVMRQDEYGLVLYVGKGAAEHAIYTCDLSAQYVRINADYRS